jgi:copper chaperone
MESITLNVSGMSCENCVGHVVRALTVLPGTSNIKVDLNSGIASLDYDPEFVTLPQIISAVDEEGYSAAARAN